MMRELSGGKIRGNIRAAMELLCTKDKDCSYQNEWRLIGKASDHCKDLKIINIYQGFNVAQSNESKMKSFAKKYGFWFI